MYLGLDNIFEEVILSSVFKSEKYNSFDISAFHEGFHKRQRRNQKK